MASRRLNLNLRAGDSSEFDAAPGPTAVLGRCGVAFKFTGALTLELLHRTIDWHWHDSELPVEHHDLITSLAKFETGPE